MADALHILGSSGLIGAAIAARLAAQQPRLLGRGDGMDARIDLADAKALQAGLFAGGGALVHAAGVTDEEFASDAAAAWQRSALGSKALIAAAKGAGVTRMVYISTAHVYGPLEGEIDEARPVNPMNDYALAHYAAEQWFRRAARVDGMDVLILRPCAVYGLPPDLTRFKRWSLIPFSFPRELLEQGCITLKSDGSQRRNFVSAGAIAAQVAAFLAEPALPGRCRVVNPVGPDDMTVLDFAEQCVALLAPLMPARGRVLRPPPAASGLGPAPLLYRSAYTSADARSTLEETIRALGARLRADLSASTQKP